MVKTCKAGRGPVHRAAWDVTSGALRQCRSLILLLLCFTVSASVLRVLDGDTFVASAVIWFASGGEVTATERVRVLGVNTPERTGETKTEGEAAKAFTTLWLRAAGNKVNLAVCKRDSFGRVLADVTRDDGRSLATDLLAAGQGVPYR